MKRMCALWVMLLAALLLIAPSDIWADNPVKKLRPMVFDSDPEVPDAGRDRQAYTGSHESKAFDEARIQRPSAMQAVRPENWLRRILRIMRALSWGGLVR